MLNNVRTNFRRPHKHSPAIPRAKIGKIQSYFSTEGVSWEEYFFPKASHFIDKLIFAIGLTLFDGTFGAKNIGLTLFDGTLGVNNIGLILKARGYFWFEGTFTLLVRLTLSEWEAWRVFWRSFFFWISSGGSCRALHRRKKTFKKLFRIVLIGASILQDFKNGQNCHFWICSI